MVDQVKLEVHKWPRGGGETNAMIIMIMRGLLFATGVHGAGKRNVHRRREIAGFLL